MSLAKWYRQRRLKRLEPTADEVARLLHAAERRLADAENTSIYPETRLEQAYQVILTCAIIALRATGYRVSTSRGRHVLALESLHETLGLDEERVGYYQTLRTVRHRGLYEGFLDVDEGDLFEALAEAKQLLGDVQRWLTRHHPGLVTAD